MPAPPEFLAFVDANAQNFITRLGTAVAIPSVSGEQERRPDVVRMGEWLKTEFTAVGVEVQLVDVNREGLEPNLPPVLLGRIGADSTKKTILIYGHYDVQPAKKSDGWTTEDPFKLEVRPDGRMIARGSTDDKGPILGWLNVLQYHYDNQMPLPVNLKFCFEGMEEVGSEGLDDLVNRESQPGGWFHGTDAVCISDNYWLNTRTPVLTYGLRGLSYFQMTVTGPARDLHSGVFGRTVHEPMTDLTLLLSKLVTVQGIPIVPGVENSVMPPDLVERAIYERLDYSIKDIEDAVGAPIALSDDKVEVLMGRMRYPSLSIHGIEGAFDGPGEKTVIPAKVTGKFSIRLVPPQSTEIVNQLVINYLNDEFRKLGSKNKFEVKNTTDGEAWVTDPDHWNFEAAKIATREIYNKEPDLTREGGSIPVTLTFADALKVNVMLLPMGRGDDGAHSTDEKLDRSNFLNGTKLLGTYLYEVANINTGGQRATATRASFLRHLERETRGVAHVRVPKYDEVCQK